MFNHVKKYIDLLSKNESIVESFLVLETENGKLKTHEERTPEEILMQYYLNNLNQ
jgi:hypothetical protein